MEFKNQVDDRTFRVDFSVEGLAKLREQIQQKLEECMGEFTDDTLCEYVVVLLRNGRRKEEAKSELDVFLGDESESFVRWLWDHLASNLDEYIQALHSSGGEVLKTKPTMEEDAGRKTFHKDSESDQGKAAAVKSRHKREWKGLRRDGFQPPLLYSTVTDNVHSVNNDHHSIANLIRQSVSQSLHVQRKRMYADECERPKIAMEAPRRLLQCAVRDALATNRPTFAFSEPNAKRLRSMVPTCTSESTHEASIQAVAEAAQYVARDRSSNINVLDHLSQEITVPESIYVSHFSGEHGFVVEEFEDYYRPYVEVPPLDCFQSPPLVEHYPIEYCQSLVQDDLVDCCQLEGENNLVDYYCLPPEEEHQLYIQQEDYGSEYFWNANMMQSDTGLASDDGGYDNVNVIGQRFVDASPTDSSSQRRRDDTLMLEYGVSQDTNQVAGKVRRDNQDRPDPKANTSCEVLNISANINTRRPSYYQPPSGSMEANTLQSLLSNPLQTITDQALTTDTKDKHTSRKGKSAMVKSHKALRRSAVKPVSDSTARPLEDADSRTLFVSNVHYGATKDSLSRHFNKFGQVLKVVILTNVTTGQPRGSAYVEFLCKEAAENSLSLDGSYFMARMLKVMRKSSAPQEEAIPTTTLPRVSQCFRYPWAPFPRGSYRPGVYTIAGSATKPGTARNMQWKRDGMLTAAKPSGTGRGLTYVRSEAKPAAAQKEAF